MIKPVCSLCLIELQEFGAIILSPPDRYDNVKKHHICIHCYQWLENIELKQVDGTTAWSNQKNEK